MAQVDVTPEVLMAKAGDARSTNSEVQTILSQLRGQISAVDGVWKGEAKVAFDNLMIRWDTDARKLNEALDTIAETLSTSAGNFSQSQADHVQSLNTAGGSLNL